VAQRQYDETSAFTLVVLIDGDRQNGQAVGAGASGSGSAGLTP
jgi:hypothetical protein